MVGSNTCNWANFSLFITGQTIVGPSDYILRLVFFYFYSGAVRGLLIGRSQQAIYRIVRNRCGYKTTLSDFHYVISGLNGEPKSASFFAFLGRQIETYDPFREKQPAPNSGHHCPKTQTNL